MNFSIETAAFASSLGLFTLSATYLYLTRVAANTQALAWWAFGFFALSIDYGLVASGLLATNPYWGLVWEGAHATFVCAVLIGVMRFLEKPVSWSLVAAGWIIIEGWGAYSINAQPGFFFQALPASLIASGFIGFAGYRLWQFRSDISTTGYRFAAVAFYLWALNRLDYQLLAFFPEIGPFGFIASQIFGLAMSIGLIVAVLEKQRREALSAEQIATDSQRQFQRVLRTSPVGIVVADPDSEEVIYTNPAFDQMALRATPLEGQHRLLTDYLKPSAPLTWHEMMDNGLSGDTESGVVEFKGTSSAGEILWLINTARAIRWEGRQVVQNTLIDITERKAAEQTIAAARAEAERASDDKTKILAAASHDLRQPIQALMLFSETLSTYDHDEESTSILGKFQASLDGVKSLLDTLLDISKLDAGLIVPQSRIVPLGTVLSHLNDQHLPLAEERRIQFRCVPTSLHVVADPVLLEDIFRNLIGNAIKYTDQGKVLIGCRRRGAKVHFEVWDTGRGIPQEQLEEIFTDFHQVTNQGRDRRQGLGLGLSIVNRMAKLMDMKVNVSSKDGVGSMFSIEMPVADAPVAISASEAHEAPVASEGALIALIDNELDILESMGQLLIKWNYDVLAFDKVGDEEATPHAADSPPDLIIADYRLAEGENGVRAIERLRDRFGTEIPALLLTGDTSPSKLTELAKTGLPVLHKPFRPKDLLRVVGELTGSSATCV